MTAYRRIQEFLSTVTYKRILVIFLCVFFSVSIDFNSPAVKANDTVDYLFSLNNIEVVRSETVESAFPAWAKMDSAKEHTSLSYWVNTVLPFSADRNANAYVIYPQLGVVVPVLTPNANDAALINAGKAFNHYPYLEKGALHYFGVSPSRGAGNMSIAAHSSYYKNDIGRYKTVFQVLPISHKGDAVWYFEKNAKGTYDRYEYEVSESFETPSSNVSILSYNNDGKTYMTTYGCYPIGSNERRWVNKSVLVRTTLEHSSLDVSTDKQPTISPTPSAPVDTPKAESPTQLIGKKALDNVLASNSPFATPLTASPTVVITQPTAGGTPQDIASRIAAAMKGDSEDTVMLGAAPTKTQLQTTPIKPTRKITPAVAKNTLAPDMSHLEPTAQIAIDVTDKNKIMRNAIVQTTKLGAGDVLDVRTVTNPVLMTESCYTPKENSIIVLGENTKSRDQIVFQGLMHAYGLTSFADTDAFKPENGLKRYEAAKILVTFAKNVLCRKAKTTYTEGMYKDIEGVDPTLVPYIKQAYEYGIMKGGKGKFRPLDRISKQEFIAGLMRIVLNSYLTEGNDKDRYKNYETVFAGYGLKTLVLHDTVINRYDMSKIFYKIYYNDQYTWTNQGYVLPSDLK